MIQKKGKKRMVQKPKSNPLDISIGGIPLGQKALLARHLAIMLKAGLSLSESLKIVHESSKGVLRKRLESILHSVTAGRSFAESLTDHPKDFSGLFVSAVRAGEASGSLEQNLENLAVQLEKDKELISKIKGAMLYPIIVLIATVALGLVVSFFVLPQITPLFLGMKQELPVTTRLLIQFSQLIQYSGATLITGLVAFIIFFMWLVKQKFAKPVTHWLFLNIPVIKEMTLAANLSRFSRTLGMLLKSGLRIDEALSIMKEILGNVYYRRVIIELETRVTKGGTLYENLENYPKLFPIIVTHMIRVGENSGKLEETLLYLGDYYETEVDTATKTLSTVIEPLLLIGIGCAVAFLALSIITPIYNITGGVKK